MLRVIIIVTLTLFFLSCNRETVCVQPTNVFARAGFYTLDTADKFVDSIVKGSNFVTTIGDTTYFFAIANKNRAFSLSSVADSTTVIFQTDSSTTNPSTLDTITYIATREPKFISVACGFQYNFFLNKINYSKNFIDSIWIVNEKVDDNANTEHVRILLKKQ